jgi:Skp family chaperone for outer membrane proteins
MATTPETPQTERPFDVESIENEPLFHRWLALASRTLPDCPERLLQLYYATEGGPSVALIAETIQCPPAEAEDWAAQLAASLVSPWAYGDVTDAEDALAEYRQRRSTFQQRVQDMQQRVQALDGEMAALDKLGDVPGRREAIDAELTPLRDERRELLTSLERDIPRQADAYRQEGDEVRQQLEQAQQQYHEAELAQLQDVWQQRLQEALPLIQPAMRALQLMQYVDVRAQQLGLDPREIGSQRLLDGYISRLRKASGTPVQTLAEAIESLPPPPRLSW